MVVEFPREGYKIRKVFLLQINIPKGNYCSLWTDVAASHQKVQKPDFQSQFSMSKMMRIFPNFSSKNINLSAHFLLLTFLTTSIFKTIYFLKWCPIFDDLLLHQFTKYNNFFLVYWFLGKNLYSFVSFENSTTEITLL